MAATYTLISSNVLSTTAASVTFSSIPATYTDLIIKYSARTDESGSYFNDTKLTFNGSTASNYSVTAIYGKPGDPGSLRSTSAANIGRNYINAASATTNAFASGEVYIPSYTTSQNKPLSAFNATETNGSLDYQTIMAAVAGLFRDTTAISSITIAAQGSTLFIAGSSFYLYGIKNS